MTSTGEPAFGNGELDAVFADTARRTGASIGALYLLAPDEQSLRLALLSGAPAEFAAPWARVPTGAPAPVAVATPAPRSCFPTRWHWRPRVSQSFAGGARCC